jgi:hypothetical protein
LNGFVCACAINIYIYIYKLSRIYWHRIPQKMSVLLNSSEEFLEWSVVSSREDSFQIEENKNENKNIINNNKESAVSAVSPLVQVHWIGDESESDDDESSSSESESESDSSESDEKKSDVQRTLRLAQSKVRLLRAAAILAGPSSSKTTTTTTTPTTTTTATTTTSSSSIVIDDNLLINPTLAPFVLCIDVGTHLTKFGLAVADATLAIVIGDAPFVAVSTLSTRDLFADRDRLAERLYGAVAALLGVPPTAPNSMRLLAHVMLAFPGRYYHAAPKGPGGKATMRFAPAFKRDLSPVWQHELGAHELANVLGVSPGRITFMNSRTASGWSFVERFGCAQNIGLILTLGAVAGVFGVWRGLMCFTRDSRGIPPTAEQQEHQLLRSTQFDGGAVSVESEPGAAAQPLRTALAYGGRSHNPQLVVRAINAAASKLCRIVSDHAARHRRTTATTAEPLMVYIAGGGIADDSEFSEVERDALVEESLRQLRVALPDTSVRVEIAPDALFNDLRGLIYFYRLCRPQVANGAALQRHVDEPKALFREQQLFRHDVVTEMLAFCAQLHSRVGSDGGAEMTEMCQWLLNKRQETMARGADELQAHAALAVLVSQETFLIALEELPDGGDAIFLLGFVLDVWTRAVLPTVTAAGTRQLRLWIVDHWRPLALALLSPLAKVAFKALTDVLLDTPPSVVAAGSVAQSTASLATASATSSSSTVRGWFQRLFSRTGGDAQPVISAPIAQVPAAVELPVAPAPTTERGQPPSASSVSHTTSPHVALPITIASHAAAELLLPPPPPPSSRPALPNRPTPSTIAGVRLWCAPAQQQALTTTVAPAAPTSEQAGPNAFNLAVLERFQALHGQRDALQEVLQNVSRASERD